MIRIFGILIVVSVMSAACSKEKSNRDKVAGVWEIQTIEQEFYAGNQVDSTATQEDAGRFVLINEGASDFNGFYFDFQQSTSKFAFVPLIGAQGLNGMKGECNWIMDDVSDERLTLFVGSINSNWYTHISFSRIQKSQGIRMREKWQYLELNPDGTPSVREVYTLKRVKS